MCCECHRIMISAYPNSSLLCQGLTVVDADPWSGDSGDHPGLGTQWHGYMTASHRQGIVTDPTYHFLLATLQPPSKILQSYVWV